MKEKLRFINKSRVFIFLISILIQSFSFGAIAARNITGEVRESASGEPLIGCSVTVKGTTIGVITDVSGKYSINVTDDNATLVFAFIGYSTEQVKVGTQSIINVRMKSNAAELSEIVVIGYGSTSSKDITGSAKSVKSENFNKGIINSPEQLLQGKVAGVNINAANGEPGGKLNITIRGPGGVRTGSTPLFVIDGFALDNSSVGGTGNPLNFLNPDDIESMDVLKDASATAIYGARGANGVIIITTKKGKAGTSKLNYSSSVGVSKLARSIDVFTADEFRAELKKFGTTFIDEGGSTDWQNEITRQAITQNHNLSLSGGTDKLKYFGSFGMQQQEGILKGNDIDRYTGRVNLNQTLLENRLSVDVNISASSTNNLRPQIQTLIGTALSMNPTYGVFDNNGNIKKYTDGTSPYLVLQNNQDITKTYRVLGNISPSLTIFKGLVYKLNFGIDNATSARDLQNLPFKEPFSEGRLETINTLNTNKLIENYLTYSLNSSIHNLTALIGHSYQKIYAQGRSYSINKFPITEIEPQFNPGLGQDLTLINNKPGGFAIVNELQSFYSRAAYSYKDKYLATATVRVDGSSKFGSNNKYGVFPSFSVGWRISEEDFLKSTVFNDLKLRAGWGQTGNQEIPSKITQALFTSQVSGTASYPLDNTNVYPGGTTYARLANPNIQWEVSAQTDIGLDFGLFNGALTGTIDYFDKKSNNILLEVIPSDPVQPAGTFWTNVSDMIIRNSGVEFDLNYRKSISQKLRYEIGGNITFIKNNVTGSPYSVIPSGSATGAGLTSATINGYINGQPIGTFFLKEFVGFDEKGLNKFADTDGDGIVSDKDRIAAGTALPKKMYNINASMFLHNFDLSLNFNGVSGNKVYDNTANANFYKLRLSKGVNTTAEASKYPEESLSNSAPISTRFLKDGAFFRLNNLNLGYNFNTTQLGINKWIPTLRLSFTGQNLFLVTKYDGYDPDVNNDRAINGVSSYGIDYLSYPKAKSFIFGLNVGL